MTLIVHSFHFLECQVKLHYSNLHINPFVSIGFVNFQNRVSHFIRMITTCLCNIINKACIPYAKLLRIKDISGCIFIKKKRFLFKTAFFGHTLKIIQQIHFWCTIVPLGPHSVYT